MAAEWICHPAVSDPGGLERIYLRRMGYADTAAVSPHVLEHARDALQAGIELSRPTAIVKLAVVEEIAGHEIHAQGMTIESALWAELSSRAAQPVTLAVFALTLGKELSRETENAREHALSRAYFLHEAGSEIIETAAGQLETMLRQRPELRDLASSRRFSPGYCDIPLCNQKAFFRFLNPEAIDIHMTASGGMWPEKSITAAVLFSESLPARSPCPDCSNAQCPHRRGKKKPSF